MPQIFEDLGVTSAGDEEDDSSVILSPRGTATGVEDRRKEAGVDACNGEAGEDRRGEGQGLRCEGWRLAQGPPRRRGEGRRRPAATIPDPSERCGNMLLCEERACTCRRDKVEK